MFKQLNEIDLQQHVMILGWLHIITSVVFILVGVIGFIFLTGIAALSGDAEATTVLGFIGTVGVLFFGILALPGIASGIGLLKRHPWGRILALVVAFLGLFNVPIGTAVSLYTFWVLMQESATEYFVAFKPA